MSNADKRMYGALLGLAFALIGAGLMWGWAGTFLVGGALVYQGIRL